MVTTVPWNATCHTHTDTDTHNNTVTEKKKTKNKPVSISGYDSNKDLAEALNTFYLRFDSHEFADELSTIYRESAPLTKSNTMFECHDVTVVLRARARWHRRDTA